MRRDSFLRRATIWLATVGYALVVSGLPLPLGGVQPASPTSAAAKRLAGKDRSQPFPCMDKPCGCTTAEQCFANCCCNTPAELLVWAKTHRVEPGLIAALRRRVAAAPPATAAATSCCAAKQQAACCTAPPVEAPRQPADPADEPVSRHTVVLSSMLACGGIVSQWLAIGGALPPPAVVAVVFVTPLGELCAAGDDVCRAERVKPDAPPPRVA